MRGGRGEVYDNGRETWNRRKQRRKGSRGLDNRYQIGEGCEDRRERGEGEKRRGVKKKIKR